MSTSNTELRVRSPAGVKTKRQTRVRGNAHQHGRWICDEANGRVGPRADEEDGVDLVEAQHSAGHHGPEVLGHMLDEGAEELGILCVPATCHVEDCPEEHGLCFVAFVGFLSA